MEHYVVIGDPIGHSRSPAMQNAAFAFYGIDARDSARHVPRGTVESFLEEARRELAGFNLTVPHKAAVIPFLDEITPEAAAAGSVNTVTVRGGRLLGDTTDGYGLEQALLENFRLPVAGRNILLLGGGGAAHAVAFRLAARGAHAIRILNRTREKAEKLAARLRRYAPAASVEVLPSGDSRRLAESLADTAFLVQATSLGLQDGDPPPFDLDLLDSPLPELRVFDMIYRETPLLKRAAARGIPAAGGMSMLIHQGAKSFEIWTGRKAPVEVMKRGFLSC